MARSRKTHPEIWERTFLLNRFLYKELSRQTTERLPVGNEGRVLDVGCGSQPYRDLFEGRCKKYFGCDYYVTGTDAARAAGDALPYGDDEFETVVLFQVLEHVPRPWKVVEECARVLKPGGFLLASVPFLFPHHPSPNDFYRYTHEGLASLAEQSDLQVREITAQVRSITTLCLILTWYLGMVQGQAGEDRPLGPLGDRLGRDRAGQRPRAPMRAPAAGPRLHEGQPRLLELRDGRGKARDQPGSATGRSAPCPRASRIRRLSSSSRLSRAAGSWRS